MTAMPDNWSYVAAAYGIAAVALIGYWRYLSARARALTRSDVARVRRR